MHAKNNRLNKDFQIAYFLAGSCHTPDGAYALLKDLQEDREMALAQLEAGALREQAKVLKCQHIIETGTPWEKLEAEADLADIKNHAEFGQRGIDAAKKELVFINKCIERIQPHRKYAHLPDSEAHEAAQAEEWKLEFISRAENNLLTTGTIPTDQLIAMRQHPEFEDSILPKIEEIKFLLQKGDPLPIAIENLNKNKFDVVKLLEAPK
jgi:hypothetical protein